MKYVINENYEKEFVINKSKFIVCLIKINDKSELDINIDKIKIKYQGATHYCYAYIIDSYEKCSDDKEPSGTAGLPILNVLKKNNLNKILCVVIRYFGGIKLGAGGLLRAYSSTVSDTLKEITFLEDIEYKNICIEFGYDKIKDIEYFLKDYEIINKSFNDVICFEFKVNVSDMNKVLNYIKNLNIKIK